MACSNRARVIAYLLLAVCGLPTTTDADDLRTPVDVVTRYCTLHANGVEFRDDYWNQINKLILWTDEPSWDVHIVIASFKILGSSVDKTRATVDVRYEILGVLEGYEWIEATAGSFDGYGRTPTVHYVLNKTRSGWKIADPSYPPRVKLGAAITAVAHWLHTERRENHPTKELEVSLDEMRKLAAKVTR